MLAPCAAAAASHPMSARSSSSSDPSASAGTNLFPAATQTSVLWLCTSTEPFGDHVYKASAARGRPPCESSFLQHWLYSLVAVSRLHPRAMKSQPPSQHTSPR